MNDAQISVHVCEVTGFPPVHPVGVCVSIVRLWFPFVHVLQLEYVNEVQVVVQVCVSVGEPPLHPVGVCVNTLLV